MKKRFSKYYFNTQKTLKNQRSFVIHIEMKYMLTQRDPISLTIVTGQSNLVIIMLLITKK